MQDIHSLSILICVKGGQFTFESRCFCLYKVMGQKCSVKENENFKRCKDVLEEVEMFYLCDMFSYFGEVSEVVNARIGSAWKKLKSWLALSLLCSSMVSQS